MSLDAACAGLESHPARYPAASVSNGVSTRMHTQEHPSWSLVVVCAHGFLAAQLPGHMPPPQLDC
eukprot:2496335-Alexandrium_andersonii.AAC.1